MLSEKEKIGSDNFVFEVQNTTANAKRTAAKIAALFKNKELSIMSKSNKLVVPEAREALDRFKMESASEVGVNLKQGYNGDLTSKQAGSVGGQMVKKMIEAYENSAK